MTGTALDLYKQLSPEMQMAAYLEAQGKTPTEVAKIVNVARKTIYDWRTRQVYTAEVARFSDLNLEQLESLTLAHRTKTINAAQHGIDKLVALLDAQDDKGQPKHTIQLAAAVALQEALKDYIFRSNENGQKGATAQAAVIVVQREGGVTEIKSAKDVQEIIDGPTR